MGVELFAGIHVSDIKAARAWYERLFGVEPSFFPNDVEAVWQVDEHRFVYLLESAEHAGHSLVTLIVDDLDTRVAGASGRGIEPAEWENYEGDVRKAVFRDPDGNELGLGHAPS